MDDECAGPDGASHIAGKKRKMFKYLSMKYDEDKKEYILHTHPEIHRWGVPNNLPCLIFYLIGKMCST